MVSCGFYSVLQLIVTSTSPTLCLLVAVLDFLRFCLSFVLLDFLQKHFVCNMAPIMVTVLWQTKFNLKFDPGVEGGRRTCTRLTRSFVVVVDFCFFSFCKAIPSFFFAFSVQCIS